tara:strand:- start:2730 stop:3554 length:825 start_codon:yes stop_codon:yes gene_type:complete
MPTFTGKTFASFYKNILGLNQTSNTGVTTSAVAVQDGAGQNTAISLSDDAIAVIPQNDNTTTTFIVTTASANHVLAVDTTNSKVLVGASQVAANTQYVYFGIDNNSSSGWAADTHYGVPFIQGASSGEVAPLGSSTSSSFNDTNPATSLTLTGSSYYASNYWVHYYWYIMDNITVDAVKWWHGADTATGDSTAAHLMAYSVVSDNSSTSGNLSGGVVVADGATITNAGYEQMYYQSLTVQSADVDAGKVVMFTFAADTVNSDYSINATVKYHIR